LKKITLTAAESSRTTSSNSFIRTRAVEREAEAMMRPKMQAVSPSCSSAMRRNAARSS